MNTCNNSTELINFITVNGGDTITGDIFVVEGNVYCRILNNKQYVSKTYQDVVIHRTVQSDLYLCWNYNTFIRRYIDSNTFYTQLKVFKLLKENHENFMDDLVLEMLNKDLLCFAIQSEHML
jgi:hypothetical protein